MSDKKEEINGNGEEVDTSNIKPADPCLQVYGMRSEYSLQELKLIYETLGQVPITLDGDAIQKLTLLRNKIKNDFDLKQKNMN